MLIVFDKDYSNGNLKKNSEELAEDFIQASVGDEDDEDIKKSVDIRKASFLTYTYEENHNFKDKMLVKKKKRVKEVRVVNR